MTGNIDATYSKRAKRWKLTITGLIFLLLLTVIISLGIGSSGVSFNEIMSIIASKIPFLNTLVAPNAFTESQEAIILVVRLPRVLAGVIIGAALATGGVLYQGIFRNPMADPSVLGVSAGASVGAGVGLLINFYFQINGFPTIPTIAFVGGLATIFIVYTISRVGTRVPEMSLLLTGVAATFFLSALYQIMQVLAPSGAHLQQSVFWLIGGISNVGWSQLYTIFPVILLGIVVSFFFSRDLNMMSLGGDTAQHLGVNTERSKKILITIGALITATAVSISGLIGFVGLMIPHITRIVIGPDHRILIPASLVTGGIFLVACDTLARVATGADQLPAGALTSLAGGLFFIFLLKRRKLDYRM